MPGAEHSANSRLTRVGARLRAAWRGAFEPRRVTIGIAALVVLVVELVGRRVASCDSYDGLAALVLAALGIWVFAREPQWFAALSVRLPRVLQRIHAAWVRRGVDRGVDLRGSPALERAVPRAAWWRVVAVAALMCALWPVRSFVPGALRDVVVPFAFVPWVLYSVVLWSLGILVGLVVVALPLLMAHELLRARGATARRHALRVEVVVVLAYLVVLFVAWRVVPPGWHGEVQFFAAWSALLFAIPWPLSGQLDCIWRSRRPADSRLRAMRWQLAVGLEWFALSGGVAVLALLCGAGSPDLEGVVLTTELGGGLAIAATLCQLVVWTAILRFWWIGYRTDPARPVRCPVRVRFEPDVPRSEQRWALVELSAARGGPFLGFSPLVGGEMRTAEVTLHLSASAPDVDLRFADLSEPILPAAAADPEIRFRLRKRHEVRCRRLLVRGLATLFKRAAAREFRRGSGFLVAPHVWWMRGLRRDESEPQQGWSQSLITEPVLGPPYRQCLPRVARHHCARVFGDLGVDLVFVEDGVGFRGLRRALRIMFDLWDKQGDARYARDSDFRTLHRVRAVLHEMTPDAPFRSDTYPEPKFQALGRARVLHLFRDRGDEVEPVVVPSDFEGVPVGV